MKTYSSHLGGIQFFPCIVNFSEAFFVVLVTLIVIISVLLRTEVTSVEMNKTGGLLLSGSKDNSNRLWDVRLVSSYSCYCYHFVFLSNFWDEPFCTHRRSWHSTLECPLHLVRKFKQLRI